MLKLFFLLILCSHTLLFACEVTHSDKLFMSISPNTGDFFYYTNQGKRRTKTSIQIKNCEKVATSNKYIMMAFGPENQEMSDRIGVFDFTNQYRDSKCFIKNPPFPTVRNFTERNKELQRRWNTINSCFKIQLEEKVSGKIQIPSGQDLCKIEVIDQKTVNLTGGVCFLKPFSDTDLSLKFLLNDHCRGYEGLMDIGSIAYDLEATLNFYISGDTTGNSIDLNSIESLPLRISFAPNKALIPLSDDMGGEAPQFPSFLEVPDIHLGVPEMTKIHNEKIIIKPNFWIDHHCPSYCREDICQSVCDYAQPFFGKFDFFEVQNDQKPILMTSWFSGGISRPRFQGEMSIGDHELDQVTFDNEKTYRIEVSFTDPKYDYEEFRSVFLSKIQRIQNFPNERLSNNIPEIPSVLNLRGITKIPDFIQVPQINFSTSLSNNFQRFLQSFSNNFSYQAWPPYFEKICSEKNCLPISHKPYLKLGLDFKIIPSESNPNKYHLKILRQYRSSSLVSNYDKKEPAIPEIICPFFLNSYQN